MRSTLTIPSRFFLARGFSPAILDVFDVGDSAKLKRAVVPLYDDQGVACIGYAFRSIKPYCDACRKHHDAGVTCRWGQQKWGINAGFPRRSYLYNFAAAKKSDGRSVFLVEGPPDVWRLAEAGCVAVALLGSDATDEQLRKLANLGKAILVAFDNDAAGEGARVRFRRKLEFSSVEFPWTFFAAPAAYKDIGDTPVDELREAIRLAQLL